LPSNIGIFLIFGPRLGVAAYTSLRRYRRAGGSLSSLVGIGRDNAAERKEDTGFSSPIRRRFYLRIS